MDKRASAEQQIMMRAGINILTSLIWTCATKTIKAPYRSSDVTPEELTNFRNCMEKHIEILKSAGEKPSGPM